METVGEFHWLTSERQIDAVTAVSGMAGLRLSLSGMPC